MHLLPLVDQYGHGVLHGELGLGAFERHLARAAGVTPEVAGDGSFFDTRTGLALRRWCPPLLGLEPHCPAVRYLARRRELGAYAAGRALLRGSGIGAFLVDDGCGRADVTPGELTSPRELAAAVGGRPHELVGLGRLAARVADTAGTVRSFISGLAQALHDAAARADTAAFVCDARSIGDATVPGLGEVQRAVGRWLSDRDRWRPDTPRHPDGTWGAEEPEEPVLVRHLLWCALGTGRPTQLHCGDPTPFTGMLRDAAGLGTIILLPRRPHHRAAARLAAAFPHVYADVGPEPRCTLDEAPFGKLLFSTGARALPELHVVRVRQFERAMERLLGDWVADEECTLDDAERIGALVAGVTARRIYRLDAPAAAG